VLFDAATGEQRVWLPRGEVVDGIRDIASSAFSPDGRSFTFVSHLRKTYRERETTLEVFVWDTRTGVLARPPISRKSTIVGGNAWILFSPNGEPLMATAYAGGMTLLSASTGAERWSIVPAREPEFLTVSSDGARVLSGWKTTFDETLNLDQTRTVFGEWSLEVWDAASGTPLDAVTLRQFDIRPLPDGRTLAVTGVPPDTPPPVGRPAGADKDLRLFVWDMTTRTRGWTQKAVADWLVVSPAGRTVAVSEQENSARSRITLRDAATGKSSRCVIKTGLFERAVLSFDASLVAVAANAAVTLWNVATCRSTQTLKSSSGSPSWLTFSPDGRFLAGGSRDSAQSTIWDLATGRALRTLDGVKGDFPVSTRVDAPHSVLSPDAKMMALATGDGNAVLIDVESGSRRWVLPEAQPPFAFSPNGKVLWTAGSGVIKAWLVADGSLLVSRVILPHGDASGHDWLAFTPQGYYDGTPESERYVIWREGDRFSAPPVFRERFHSADRLREALDAGQSGSGR
jgi:WD40 repeat protein